MFILWPLAHATLVHPSLSFYGKLGEIVLLIYQGIHPFNAQRLQFETIFKYT